MAEGGKSFHHDFQIHGESECEPQQPEQSSVTIFHDASMISTVTTTGEADTIIRDGSILHRSVSAKEREFERLKYSPHLKPTKVDQLADFLKTKFILCQGSKLSKARAASVVRTEYDSRLSVPVIGRAMGKAFGHSNIHPHGRKLKDEYANVKEVEATEGRSETYLTATTSIRKRERVPSSSPDTPTRAPILSTKRVKSTEQQDHEPSTGPGPALATKTIIQRVPESTLSHLTLASCPAATEPVPHPDPAPPTIRTSRIPVRYKDFELTGLKRNKRAPGVSKIPRLSPPESTNLKQTNLLYGAKQTVAIPRPDRSAVHPYNVPMLVSVDEARVLGMMREGELGTLKYIKKKNLYSRLDSTVVEFTQEKIRGEVMAYANKSECLMRKASAKDMEKFSITDIWEEFQECVPTLVQVIISGSTRKEQHTMTNKRLNTLNPAITFTVAKCLAIYSNHLSASRTMYGIILSNGGLTDTCMNRMAKLYDTVTHQNLLKKLNNISQRHKLDLDQWSEYNIVLDNVDMYVKPRRETKDKTNTMYHMVQAIAVEDRVEPPPNTNKAPEIPVSKIVPSDVYPTASDDVRMRKLLYERVLEILMLMPALKDISIELPSQEHQYSAQMSRKSKQVNLGVLQKNENVKEELLVCLQLYHNLVSEGDGSSNEDLQHKFCIGDYLTFERGQQVLHTQSDGRSEADRLEGLLMAMADFHVQMNYLKLVYRILFQSDSQASPGTLTHAKAFLNAKNVVSDPTKRYYDCGAMFDKVFYAYVFTAGIKELGLESIDKPGMTLTSADVERAAAKIVTKYTDLQLPDLYQTGKIRCPHCNTKYATEKNLRKHHIQTHHNIALPPDGIQHKDAVFNYSVMVITLGLLRTIHNRAIQRGNGEHILLLYKYMFMIFKANGAYKYGCGLLETVIQTKILPEALSTRLIWNRFYNSHNKADTNIPLDLQLEHENHNFKRRLKTYRGTFSQPHLDRISQGRGAIQKMIRKLDEDIGYHPSISRSSRELPMEDINLLLASFASEELLDMSGRRTHSLSLLPISSNPITGINGKSLREWMVARIELCRIRHYYRQFNAEPASFQDSGSETDFPELRKAFWETKI